MAVCSEIHTKHINTLCGQNVELLNVKLVLHKLTTELIRFQYASSCRQHIGHVCELYGLRYYTLLVLVLGSWCSKRVAIGSGGSTRAPVVMQVLGATGRLQY
jgi:hypothetical protein